MRETTRDPTSSEQPTMRRARSRARRERERREDLRTKEKHETKRHNQPPTFTCGWALGTTTSRSGHSSASSAMPGHPSSIFFVYTADSAPNLANISAWVLCHLTTIACWSTLIVGQSCHMVDDPWPFFCVWQHWYMPVSLSSFVPGGLQVSQGLGEARAMDVESTSSLSNAQGLMAPDQ